ncbi:hypothetical protein AB0C96_36015 [Streptomyces sp. NPDC048506]
MADGAGRGPAPTERLGGSIRLIGAALFVTGLAVIGRMAESRSPNPH